MEIVPGLHWVERIWDTKVYLLLDGDDAIVGDAANVKARLDEKARATGADELFVMAVGPSLESRIRSLELIKSA